MIERLRLFWAARTVRERQLLLVMAGLFAVVVVGLGIIRPLVNAKEAAKLRLDRVTIEAGQVAAAADRLRLAEKSAPPPITVTLPLAISQSAAASGFTLSALDPQGEDRIGIGIASARSPALFKWFRDLARQGIFVERMTLRTAGDQSLSVEATLRLRQR